MHFQNSYCFIFSNEHCFLFHQDQFVWINTGHAVVFQQIDFSFIYYIFFYHSLSLVFPNIFFYSFHVFIYNFQKIQIIIICDDSWKIFPMSKLRWFLYWLIDRFWNLNTGSILFQMRNWLRQSVLKLIRDCMKNNISLFLMNSMNRYIWVDILCLFLRYLHISIMSVTGKN